MRGRIVVLVLLGALVAGVAPASGQGPLPINDGLVETEMLLHDSRDPLYRQPWGAVEAGAEVVLRIRTSAADATRVQVRVHDEVAGTTTLHRMQRAAAGIDCYEDGREERRCDWWEARFETPAPTTLYYRFLVADGPMQVSYRDDSGWTGGRGQATNLLLEDLTQCCYRDYVITVYDPSFEAIDWLADGVVYQIFPDRFRNGDPTNDPTGDEPRYDWPPDPDSQIVLRDWNDLPEGHCRFYADGCDESLRHRDYYGGDLRGIELSLDYIADLGADVLYLNPIFSASSNHAYDTRDYHRIDPIFGSEDDFRSLVDAAAARGIRIVLDGVFVATSSDSVYFDRNRRHDGTGACESPDSPYRGWYSFRPYPYGPCAGVLGEPGAYYESWHGIDMLPLLDKKHPGVRDLVYEGPDAVARRWLRDGADGWRIDSMLHPSFPDDFWRGFRTAVKDTKPDAPIVGELWHRAAVLPKVRGDMADGAMNYRAWWATISLLGTSDPRPSSFAAQLLSSLEDVPAAAALNSFNLLDSHDTHRILWRLTPGANTRAAKEFDPDAVEVGKSRLRLASLIQMTTPGAPSIYYGTEVGVTGDNDPDNRRTFPWDGTGAHGSGGDQDLREWFAEMIRIRRDYPGLRSAHLDVLHADDETKTVAYSRGQGPDTTVVAVNADTTARPFDIGVHGVVRDGVTFADAVTGETAVTSDGMLRVTLGPLSGAIFVPVAGQQLDPPAAPAELNVDGGALHWAPVPGAVTYRVYGSPLSGAGYELVAITTETSIAAVAGSHYVVRAVDADGNEGPPSPEVKL